MNRYFRLLALGGIALIVAGGAVACGGGSADGEPEDGIQVKTPGAGGDGQAAAESIKVVMKDNLFEPKALTVPAGKSIVIELKNEGQAVHNMHILSQAKEGKDFSSAATVAPGAENKFTIKLTKKGTYDFQCDYHTPDMVGTITVQ
ncbi:MAG: hypothetical protein C0506_06410 [Anaerolinea sp.]|nr:hypothetical protein [Anaerolinea sp.]